MALALVPLLLSGAVLAGTYALGKRAASAAPAPSPQPQPPMPMPVVPHPAPAPAPDPNGGGFLPDIIPHDIPNAAQPFGAMRGAATSGFGPYGRRFYNPRYYHRPHPVAPWLSHRWP